MNTLFIIAAFLVYYILLHFWVYRIYKENSPKFPNCLLYNSKTVTATGCAGIAGMALSFAWGAQTDIRILMLYYLGILLLSVLTVTDLREKRIPNRVLLIMLGVWAAFILINMLVDFYAALQIAVMSLCGMVFNGIVFIIGYFLTKKKLGGGDVKLAAVLGLFFTIDKSFGTLLYGLILCSLFSAVLMICKKAKAGTQIPLCPFLFAGALIMLQIN
ncbi:MAG: prepilin peptidase [Huintestinicola sp.]|uniref:prepilin peptidase n=1 Tax=Huintestinicola sp. TaxID=2981661 RepID=UPI003EFCB55F